MKKSRKNNLFEQNKEIGNAPDGEMMSKDVKQNYTPNNTTSPVSTPDGPQQVDVTPYQNFSSGSMGGSIYSSNWTPNTGCSIDVTTPAFDPCSGTMAQQFSMINGAAVPNTCDYIGEVDLPSNPNWYNDSGLPPWLSPGLCDTSKDACIVFDTDTCKFWVSDNNGTWSNPCETAGCDWGTTGVGNDALMFNGKYCTAANLCEDRYDGQADFVDCATANCGGGGTQDGCLDFCATNYSANYTGCIQFGNPPDPSNTSCCTYVTPGCLDNRQDSGGFYISTNELWSTPNAVGPGQTVKDCAGNVQLDCTAFSSPWDFDIANMSFTAGGSFSCCTYDLPNTDMNGCMEPGTANYDSGYEFDCNHPTTTGLPPMQSGDPGFVGTYGDTSCCGVLYGCTITASSSFDPLATNPCDDTNGPPCVNGQSGTNCCCDLTSITGCMDPLGSMYSATNILDCGGNVPPTGEVGNNSCCGGYNQGCMSDSAINGTYVPGAVADCLGNLVISGNEYAANVGNPYNTWPSYGTATSNPTTIVGPGDVGCCTFAINGCTDALATNECQNGCNTDDGSCIYESCPDPGASNYMEIPFNGGTQYIPAAYMYNVSGGIGCVPSGGPGPSAPVIGNTDCCEYPIAGCTDNTAFNHNAAATQDCTNVVDYPLGPPPLGPCLNDAVGTLQTGADCCCCYVEGCMDTTATNYDPNACSDDGSCFWEGCTHSLAWNYDSAATSDDGSCEYMGCADATATNYNTPGCYDANGTQVPCGGCPDIDPADPSATIDPGNTGCCQYTVGCTDPNANNQNTSAQIPCNTTGNIAGVYWGNIGWPTGAGVIVTPSDPTQDNIISVSYTHLTLPTKRIV